MKSKMNKTIIGGICTIVAAIAGNVLGQNMVEQEINNQISQNIDVDVEGMGYEKSVDYLLDRIDELEEDLKNMEKENDELNNLLEQEQKNISTPSESKVNENGTSFQNILEVLYDGDNYKRYDGDNKFSVGGKEYRYGFTVGCDRGIANFGPGYASFNLDGKYSKMSFDVGKVDGYKASATVIVTSQSGINESYPVSADSISQPIEIDVKNTEDLKITVDSDRTVEYGFFNIYLYE